MPKKYAWKGAFYVGHLDNNTKVQNETLGRFWSEKLSEAAR